MAISPSLQVKAKRRPRSSNPESIMLLRIRAKRRGRLFEQIGTETEQGRDARRPRPRKGHDFTTGGFQQLKLGLPVQLTQWPQPRPRNRRKTADNVSVAIGSEIACYSH